MKRLTYSNSMQKRRHRHKLILPLWCILLLVTGCGNLYTGDESLYDPNHQDNQGDQTQLPVMVAFSDPIYNVLTRGAGVLDPTDETNFSKRIADLCPSPGRRCRPALLPHRRQSGRNLRRRMHGTGTHRRAMQTPRQTGCLCRKRLVH